MLRPISTRKLFSRIVLILVLALLCGRVAGAQETIVTDETGTGYLRPYICWTANMEFYDPVAFPYFEVDGYYFDANPFVTTAWRENNYAMIMRSTRGWRLADMSGKKVWTDARIYVRCHIVEYFFGLFSQPYATVAWTLGSIVDRTVACNTNGLTDPFDASYEPYEASGGYNDSGPDVCTSGGTGAPPNLPPGTICNTEWMSIDMTYDGGITWQTVWQGFVKVCR